MGPHAAVARGFDPVDMPKLLPHIILVDVERSEPRLCVRLSARMS